MAGKNKSKKNNQNNNNKIENSQQPNEDNNGNTESKKEEEVKGNVNIEENNKSDNTNEKTNENIENEKTENSNANTEEKESEILDDQTNKTNTEEDKEVVKNKEVDEDKEAVEDKAEPNDTSNYNDNKSINEKKEEERQEKQISTYSEKNQEQEVKNEEPLRKETEPEKEKEKIILNNEEKETTKINNKPQHKNSTNIKEDDDDPSSFFGEHQSINAQKMLNEIEKMNEKAYNYLQKLFVLNNEFSIVKSQLSNLFNTTLNLIFKYFGGKPKEHNISNLTNQAFLLEIINFLQQNIKVDNQEIKFSEVFLLMNKNKNNLISNNSLLSNMEVLLNMNSNNGNSINQLCRLNTIKVQVKYLKKNLIIELNDLIVKSSSIKFNQLTFEDLITKIMKNSKKQTLDELNQNQMINIVYGNIVSETSSTNSFECGERKKSTNSSELEFERKKEDTNKKENDSKAKKINPDENNIETHSSFSQRESFYIYGTAYKEVFSFLEDFNINSLSVIQNVKLVFERNNHLARKILHRVNKKVNKYWNTSKQGLVAYAPYIPFNSNFNYYGILDLKSYYLLYKNIPFSNDYESFNLTIRDRLNNLINNSKALVAYFERIKVKSFEETSNDEVSDKQILFCSKFLVIQKDPKTNLIQVNVVKHAKITLDYVALLYIKLYENTLMLKNILISKYHKFLDLK